LCTTAKFDCRSAASGHGRRFGQGAPSVRSTSSTGHILSPPALKANNGAFDLGGIKARPTSRKLGLPT
jgi:hypothetical protein